MVAGGRFIQEDGSITYEYGVINLNLLGNVPNNIASFDTHIECDEFAYGHKWSVRDADGRPNHRCPECQVYEKSRLNNQAGKENRTGAYVNTKDIVPVHHTRESRRD